MYFSILDSFTSPDQVLKELSGQASGRDSESLISLISKTFFYHDKKHLLL